MIVEAWSNGYICIALEIGITFKEKTSHSFSHVKISCPITGTIFSRYSSFQGSIYHLLDFFALGSDRHYQKYWHRWPDIRRTDWQHIYGRIPSADLMGLHTMTCPTCGKEFISDIEQRAKNELEVHFQNNSACRPRTKTGGPEIHLGPSRRWGPRNYWRYREIPPGWLIINAQYTFGVVGI